MAGRRPPCVGRSYSLPLPQAPVSRWRRRRPGARTAEPQVTPAGELRDAAPEAEPATRIIPLEVSINGARAGSWVLMERGGALYAQLDAFEDGASTAIRARPRYAYRGETWYPLGSLPGFAAALQPRPSNRCSSSSAPRLSPPRAWASRGGASARTGRSRRCSPTTTRATRAATCAALRRPTTWGR